MTKHQLLEPWFLSALYQVGYVVQGTSHVFIHGSSKDHTSFCLLCCVEALVLPLLQD